MNLIQKKKLSLLVVHHIHVFVKVLCNMSKLRKFFDLMMKAIDIFT